MEILRNNLKCTPAIWHGAKFHTQQYVHDSPVAGNDRSRTYILATVQVSPIPARAEQAGRPASKICARHIVKAEQKLDIPSQLLLAMPWLNRAFGTASGRGMPILAACR